jgi:hypothetical protein
MTAAVGPSVMVPSEGEPAWLLIQFRRSCPAGAMPRRQPTRLPATDALDSSTPDARTERMTPVELTIAEWPSAPA